MNPDGEVRPRAIDAAVQVLNFLEANLDASAQATAESAAAEGVDRTCLFRAKHLVAEKSHQSYDSEALQTFAFDCYVADGASKGYVKRGQGLSLDQLRELEKEFYRPTGVAEDWG